MDASVKRGRARSGQRTLLGAAVAALLAFFLVVPLTACGSETLSLPIGDEGVFVPEKITLTEVLTSGSTDGSVDEFRFERDDNGNLLRAIDSTTNGGANQVSGYVYSSDQSGYIEHADITLEQYGQKEEVGGITFSNHSDDLGRLTESTMQGHYVDVETEDSVTFELTASYEYFGDTDNIESISYAHYNTFTTLESGLVSSEFWTTLGYAMPDMFDPTHRVLQLLASGNQKCSLRFSEEGVLQVVQLDGREAVPASITLADLKNATSETGADSDTAKFIVKAVYDENGFLVEKTNTPKVSDSESSYSLAYDQRITYTEVQSPSRSVAIFNRLHFSAW